MPGGSKRRYCICRSTDGTGDMIGCDRCDEWFHYKCVGLTQATAPGSDEDYFCQQCIQKAEQCRNPRCVFEARKGSKYCSEDCGLEYNKIRYLKHFRPKMELLENKHSAAYQVKMETLEKLEEAKEDVIMRIGDLKREREDLETKLKAIKEHARVLRSESNQTKPDRNSDDSADEADEDVISSEQTKTFCNICGVEQQADKAFKHFTSCHKKQESAFSYYLTLPLELSCETDKEPNIYCRKYVDKKREWYCPNLQLVCPQHVNWNPAEDEVCACPNGFVKDLALDGNYCLKLKKECTTHYHWDRFSLAIKDYERALAFQRLQRISEDIARTQNNYNEHYGGVVGVMLHTTIDERKKYECDDDTDMIDQDEHEALDVEMK